MISVRHAPSGTSSFYGFDPMSNTRLLTSSAGTVTDRYIYKAFGEELSGSGSTNNPHRFGGQVGYYRDKIERVYVRARHYAPPTGRWLSRDPIGFDGGDFNLYKYVENNPISRIDASGQTPIVIGGIAAAIVAACAKAAVAKLNSQLSSRNLLRNQAQHCFVSCEFNRCAGLSTTCASLTLLGGFLFEAIQRLKGDWVRDVTADAYGVAVSYVVWRTCADSCTRKWPNPQ